MPTELLKNKPLPSAAEEVAKAMEQAGEQILFAVVGDMNLSGKFFANTLLFTEKKIVFVDENGKSRSFLLSDLQDVKSKRMYGNAVLSAQMPNGKREIFFRFSYGVSALCDAAALFVNHLREGKDLNEELAVMGVVFEKQLSVCPRCGRTLLHPGAPCIQCQSKKSVVGKLFKYIKPQMGTIAFCIFLSLFSTAMALVPPAITGFIVDDVFPGKNGTSGYQILNKISQWVGGEQQTVLLAMAACLAVTYLLQHAVGGLRSYLMRTVGDRAVTALRNDIFRKAQYLPMRFYDKTSTGSVISRIGGDANTIQNFTLRITQEAVVHFFQLIGIVVIMLAMNPTLTFFALFPVPIVVVIGRVFGKKARTLHRRIWRRWAAVYANLADSIPCIRVVKSFAGEKRCADRFEETDNRWLKSDLRLSFPVTAFSAAVSFFVSLGSVLIWIVGGGRVINGNEGYSAGLIVTFISYATMFYNPVTFFVNLSDSFQNTLSATEKVLDILEAEPETHAENAVIPEKLKGKIEFLHVSFSFDRTKKVLDDVSFTVNEGDVVGIVGTTGSGKTTLINLLMRYYDEYSGEILVDGHNIKNFDLPAFRGQIGYVQQEPQMFSDTIYNNIAFANPNATREDVIRATNVANAHEFIAKQPDGYDTMLGERGIGVSGGEKQRISIARAVLTDPSILIFDEATAAVDSETERMIQDAIDELAEGRTTLMIAHRLSTLNRANRIIVVDNGKIIENGTPEELMAKKGKYYKLVQIQSMVQESERMKAEERL